jgi:acetyltransferase-like isoleucine patch superfamily enzyme
MLNSTSVAETTFIDNVLTEQETSVTSGIGLRDILRIIRNLNFKTIRFNLTYFEWKDAIRFPVFVKQTQFKKLQGKIIIDAPIRPGMIRIGYGYVGHFDRALKSIWEVSGQVTFKGSALLKFGSNIVVGPEGNLQLGEKFRISPQSSIICFKRIVFGNTCRLSWEVQVLDTDFHKIKTLDGEYINKPKDIEVGNHVWIGSRVSIMKGAKIGDDCIVAANSVVTKHLEGEHQVIAGIPAKVVRTGVTWEP